MLVWKIPVDEPFIQHAFDLDTKPRWDGLALFQPNCSEGFRTLCGSVFSNVSYGMLATKEILEMCKSRCVWCAELEERRVLAN